MSAMGVEVTILGRNQRLLHREDPEVSAAVLKGMSRHMRIHTNFEVLEATREGKLKRLVAKDRAAGKTFYFAAEEILLASGRVSNADILKPQATEVEVDERGWIKTNDYLETTKKGIWAMGDCVNRGQFRHTANYHSGLVWNNMTAKDAKDKVKVDEHAIPSAVFCWPQVGSVGLTAEEALKEGFHAHVGKAMYHDTAKGYAMGDQEAFAKVVVDGATARILGAHIVGPQASVLVQLVVDMMNAEDGTYAPLIRAQTIHPSLAEVVSRAFGELQHAGPGGHEHAHGHTHGHSHGHAHENGEGQGEQGKQEHT
jgi:dihydrolipoamide dehydrogenase